MDLVLRKQDVEVHNSLSNVLITTSSIHQADVTNNRKSENKAVKKGEVRVKKCKVTDNLELVSSMIIANEEKIKIF